MRIQYLGENEVQQVAQWIYDEWGYVKPGCTLDSVTQGFKGRVGSKAMPLTLVAMDPEPVGTASLVACDLHAHPELTPWLACLYVRADKRGQGVGEKLFQRVLEEAKRLEFDKCYLYTDKEEKFYAKRDWQPIIREKHRIGDIVVMTMPL